MLCGEYTCKRVEEKKDNKNMEINDSEQEVVWVLREWQDCPIKRNTANKGTGVGTGRSWGERGGALF